MVIALGDELQTDLVPGSVVGQRRILYFTTIVRATVVIDMGDVGLAIRRGPASARPGADARARPCRRARSCQRPDAVDERRSPRRTDPTTYGAGDLTGLWQLGAAGGCTA